MPAHLRDQPYLRPVYDHPQFLVRNIWRLYGGWYDGEPDNLLPAPRAEQAREWMALAGGLDRVLARAAELRAAGNLRLACHLVEMAVVAEPASPRGPRSAGRDLRGARGARALVDGAQHPQPRRALEPGQGRRDLAGQW